MKKFILVALNLAAMTAISYAGAKITPGPLLGAVAGPWGLAASAAAYGAYRYFKAKR